MDNPAFAWLVVLLAVVIVAAYFYIKRRQSMGASFGTPRRDRDMHEHGAREHHETHP